MIFTRIQIFYLLDEKKKRSMSITKWRSLAKHTSLVFRYFQVQCMTGWLDAWLAITYYKTEISLRDDLKSSHVDYKRNNFHLGKNPSFPSLDEVWLYTYISALWSAPDLPFCHPFSKLLCDRPWFWNRRKQRVSIQFCLMLKALWLVCIEQCFWDGGHPLSLSIVKVDQTHGCISK